MSLNTYISPNLIHFFFHHIDNGNDKSKSAAIRLGFTHEGIFRQHMIIKVRYLLQDFSLPPLLLLFCLFIFSLLSSSPSSPLLPSCSSPLLPLLPRLFSSSPLLLLSSSHLLFSLLSSSLFSFSSYTGKYQA